MMIPFCLPRATLRFIDVLRLTTIFLVIGLFSVGASTPLPDYSGHYELADARADRVFSLDVQQKKQRAEVSFSVAMADGSGAAPDGAGKGKVEDGVLNFKFKDSFNNEGTCTLQPGKKGFELVMTVTKVVEPQPFHFYGSVLLKRVAK